jgi:hypothetical protein
MQRVWDFVKEYYFEHNIPSQYASLTLGSFHDPRKPRSTFPRLKGKGMEVKCCVDPIMGAFKQFKRPGNIEDQSTLECLECLSNIEHTFDEYSHEYVLPLDVAEQVLAWGDKFLELNAKLSTSAGERGDLLFHVLPKTHLYWHLLYRCRYLHPKVGSCMIDEDFVGRIKHIVVASTAGSQLHTIPAKVVEKIRWGKAYMYEYDIER